MDATLKFGCSGYQLLLQLALEDAVASYEKMREAVSKHPPLTEESATLHLSILHQNLEQRRATVLLLSACCAEALANLYLAAKCTPEQFATLEWAKFLEKWTVLPSLFVPSYSLPRDCELYQDLKRVNQRRDALVHLKEQVTRNGVTVHAGTTPAIADDEHAFIRRCATLPNRLLEHLASFDKSDEMVGVHGLSSIISVFQHMRQLDEGPCEICDPPA